MASKKRTWVWILVGVVGCCVLLVVALAGAGFYFVSKRVDTSRSTSADALASLDDVVKSLGGRPPLYTVDAGKRLHLTTPLAELPTGARRPTDLQIHIWDPRKERLVRLSLPFWMLKFGGPKIRVTHDESDFSIEQLDFDVAELERIGPVLIVDHNGEDGERVLLWTK